MACGCGTNSANPGNPCEKGRRAARSRRKNIPVLGQFVERVERRTIEIKEEAAREEEERTSARAEIPAAAFGLPLEQAGIKEHVFNILTEAGFETVGDLMFAMKTDPIRCSGLRELVPKPCKNIEEALGRLILPEPEPAPEAVMAGRTCRSRRRWRNLSLLKKCLLSKKQAEGKKGSEESGRRRSGK